MAFYLVHTRRSWAKFCQWNPIVGRYSNVGMRMSWWAILWMRLLVSSHLFFFIHSLFLLQSSTSSRTRSVFIFANPFESSLASKSHRGIVLLVVYIAVIHGVRPIYLALESLFGVYGKPSFNSCSALRLPLFYFFDFLQLPMVWMRSPSMEIYWRIWGSSTPSSPDSASL